jgi:hypothetical protein
MIRGKVGRAGVFAAVFALTGALIAHAAEGGNDTHQGDCTSAAHDTVDCHFTHDQPGTPGSPATPGTTVVQPSNGPVRPSTPADPKWVYTWQVERNAAGQPCWRGSARPAGTDPAAEQRAADAAYLAQSGGAEYPPCPVSGGPASDASPATPTVVRTADVAKRLASPTPRIEPGRAIAGKVAFLEIGGSAPRSFDVADPLGGPSAHVDARPTYRVDWGDGAVTETSSNGGPWPHGDVTHTYQRTGHYDVVVTARWTAQWSGANGEGGNLDGLSTEGRIARFPVTEVQAVRER